MRLPKRRIAWDSGEAQSGIPPDHEQRGRDRQSPVARDVAARGAGRRGAGRGARRRPEFSRRDGSDRLAAGGSRSRSRLGAARLRVLRRRQAGRRWRRSRPDRQARCGRHQRRLRLAGRSAGGAGVRDPGKLHVRAGRRDPDLLCDRAVRAGNARPDPEGREGSHSCGDRRRRSRRDLGRQASRRGDLCDGRQRREARLFAQARRPAHLQFPLARFCRRRAWPRPTATASIWC